MPERALYKSNGMDGIIHSLPTYEDSVRELAYLLGIQRIRLRSHSEHCEKMVTTDLEGLGQFIHEMSHIIYELKYSIWIFVIYFTI